jgi:alpha-galactosidase/6-phospho-beta-glucosidase family protein
MPVKISLIGAGSAVFSLNLIRDLCLTPNLRGGTISFMDIDQGRLDAAHRLCQRYAEEVGNQLILEKTTDRRESLAGADFVINTALVAGHHRLRAGWDIARHHGYRFGGSLHIMHDEAFWINFYQFRLFDSLMEDILEICPNAWYLKVDNPVLSGITYLSRKYPQAKIVGLCHGFSAVYHIADVLGLDREHLTYQIPGVNHFVWLTHLYHQGRDVIPMLDEWIETKAADYWKTCKPSDFMGPKAVDLYKRFGVFPIGDTANVGGGTWGWWYHTDKVTEERWQEDPQKWYADYFSSLDRGVERIRRVGGDPSAKVMNEFPPKMSGEVMVPMIESIACDIPRVLVGNIANSGDFVPGVPKNFAVEISTLVSKRGIQGVKTDGLPMPLISYILRDRVAPIEVELEAYETRKKELLLQLILMDRWTQSEDQACALLDEIFALPFHEEMRQHYR